MLSWQECSLTLLVALSTEKPYPGCIDTMYAAYRYVLQSGIDASRVIIAGDSAGGRFQALEFFSFQAARALRNNYSLGNAALSTCFRIIEEENAKLKLPSPAGVIMLSPWLDLTRSTSGDSPNQPTDWLASFDSEGCRVGAIEQYMGSTIKSASDPRISPLWRRPVPTLPKQFLSAGRSEVLFADADRWAAEVTRELGTDAIECHFAEGQVHTFAIGGWLADPGVEEVSDQRVLTFVQCQTSTKDAEKDD